MFCCSDRLLSVLEPSPMGWILYGLGVLSSILPSISLHAEEKTDVSLGSLVPGASFMNTIKPCRKLTVQKTVLLIVNSSHLRCKV